MHHAMTCLTRNRLLLAIVVRRPRRYLSAPPLGALISSGSCGPWLLSLSPISACTLIGTRWHFGSQPCRPVLRIGGLVVPVALCCWALVWGFVCMPGRGRRLRVAALGLRRRFLLGWQVAPLALRVAAQPGDSAFSVVWPVCHRQFFMSFAFCAGARWNVWCFCWECCRPCASLVFASFG